nr:TIGR03943 family protein [Modestobacter versicolor]
MDYVRPGFRPFLLAAGVVVVALAATGLLRRPGGPRAGHEHPGPAVGWLLAAPVAVVLVVAPPALGAYSAARLPTAPPAVPAAPPSPGIGADDPGADHRTMTLLSYTIWSQQPDPSPLADRRVRLVGFVTPREAGGWYLTRFRINCCAADATALRVAVIDGSAEFAPDQWVEVVGHFTEPVVDPVAGYALPAIEPASTRLVPPPAEPYE